MGSFPADHAIADGAAFRAALRFAEAVAREGYLVTLGVRPTYPETGYGYIHSGAPLATADKLTAHAVVRFVEKPNLSTAQTFCEQGDYQWNAGIFVWRVDRVLEEIRRHVPQIGAVLDEIGAAAAGAERLPEEARAEEIAGAIAAAWSRLTANVTIDFGVMEHADRIAVIPIDIGWNDVGSWSAVAGLHAADAQGNVVVGLDGRRCLTSETADTLIYSTTGRRIATAGVTGLVIVDTPEGLLICDREHAQLVKDLAEQAQAEREP